MFRWIWLMIAVVLALAPLGARSEPAPQRIVAIGDLHGDYEAWRAIAKAAGLIDSKGRWTGGNTALVQMGDVVDRGPDSLKIIRDLMRLRAEAEKRGGRVIVLIGNHEAMMMTGDMRYVHPGEYAPFVDRDSPARRERIYEANKAAAEAAAHQRDPSLTPEQIKEEWLANVPLGMVEYKVAWLPDGELGKWALSNPAVVKLGETIFAHGGISAAFAHLPIEEINRQTEAALKARDSTQAAIINNAHGPLWYRGLIIRNDGDDATVAPIPAGTTIPLTIEQEIDLVLRNYGAKRIVVAHTPSRQGIVSAADGRLWRVDSAISRAYGGTPSYLEIVGQKVTAHSVPRPAGKDWGTK